MAYAIAHASPTWRTVLLMMIVLPFWTSFLLRVYAWIGLLKNNGVINNILMYLGVIHEPLTLLQSDFAVYIGIVYSYLPFMILPLYANLEKHDNTLLEAAADLGATPMTAFFRITLPQSVAGIVAGSLLVFIPAVGEYVVPSLLGRTDQLMIGRVLSDEFFREPRLAGGERGGDPHAAGARDPDHAVPALPATRTGGAEMTSRGVFSRTALVFGLVFLYVPILSMIVFSFNNSRLVTVWDAAHSPTLKWYGELISNGQIMGAAWLSIRIALVAATGAVILGTLTGVALARFGPFRGRTLLSGMTTAPIVMPEVITGLSLLLMFVALEQLIGWPKGSGALTITLSHITFCMAYVTVVVQSRLVGFDESLEEAAMDLGARPGDGVLPGHAAADRAGDFVRLATGVHVVVG